MSSWSGKSKGTALGYKIFINTLRLFGLRGAYFILYFVAGYFWLFHSSSVLVLKDFYRTKFNFSPRKTRKLIYRNFYLMGQTLIDKTALASGIYTKFIYEDKGEHNIHDWIDQKKGAVLIGSHIGAWDIAAQLLKEVKSTINVVVFDAEHEELKKVLSQYKQNSKVNFIPIKEDLSHILEIKNALSNNEVVCFNGDRYNNRNNVIPMSFLGENALFPKGIFMIAAKFNTPVAYTAGVKVGFNKYKFYCFPLNQVPLSRNKKTREAQLQSMVKEYVNHLEKTVKKYPDQWFNHYDYWKTSN